MGKRRKGTSITVTDQFCGAGGSSLGATHAGTEVRLAMNHWKLAIETHNTNFPQVDHDCADISAVDPRRYPTTNILITSPECTNHSVAKGVPRRYYERDLFGNVFVDPAAERSRATMWDVPRFAEYHDYEAIITENVVDAARWRLFDSWLGAMHALDYSHEVVYFNSMFAWPTPQSRDRMYVVFWKNGNKKPDLDFRLPAHCSHCEKDVQAIQTWKKRARWGKYKSQYFYRCSECHREVTPYYYASFNAIDFSIPSVRIGDRESLGKKPLTEKTIQRIQYGLDQWGRDVMVISPRYNTGLSSRVHRATQEPVPTQPGDASHAVVMPWLIDTAFTHHKGKRAWSAADSGFTQTTGQTFALLQQGFMVKNYGAKSPNRGLYVNMGDPMGTMTASGSHHALLQADAFMSYYYGQHQATMMHQPAGTMTTMAKASLVQNVSSLRIEDLYYRMLAPAEIGRTMAFPETYKVLGTIKDQVRQYGNAVTPPVMKMLIERCAATLR